MCSLTKEEFLEEYKLQDVYQEEYIEWGTIQDIFSDYINTSNISKYYEETFEKYKITHVILKTNTKLNMLISRDENYKELYKDNSFVIYERLTK